jgi:hypothetical protein
MSAQTEYHIVQTDARELNYIVFVGEIINSKDTWVEPIGPARPDQT